MVTMATAAECHMMQRSEREREAGACQQMTEEERKEKMEVK